MGKKKQAKHFRNEFKFLAFVFATRAEMIADMDDLMPEIRALETCSVIMAQLGRMPNDKDEIRRVDLSVRDWKRLLMMVSAAVAFLANVADDETRQAYADFAKKMMADMQRTGVGHMVPIG